MVLAPQAANITLLFISFDIITYRNKKYTHVAVGYRYDSRVVSVEEVLNYFVL